VTRRSYVQIDGVLYERGSEPVAEGPMVIGDIQPYQSQITGEMITSRSQHREHLRMHNCVEVGDQVHHLKPSPPSYESAKRKELIRAQVDAMSHADFRRALKVDADRVKWNSREN
jgi:hypothetical protein